MGFSKMFESFLNQRPICVMARATLERLLDEGRINELFARVADRQYTRDLLFSDLVGLLSEVVFGWQPSVHAAYQSKIEEISVSTTALYNKLDRVETAVSAELVRDSFRQAEPVVRALRAGHPRWLRGYHVKVLDGNHLSATEHRIEELRSTWAAPLPGKALVVLDQQRMLIRDVFLTEDGHAQERSLLEDVLQTIERNDLWVADRNFCTQPFLCGIAARGGFYLIRQHSQLQGRLTGRRKRVGTTETGVVYEQKMLIRDPQTGNDVAVRRITVELFEETEDGDTEIHLLSNIPAKRAQGTKLADLYRKRWMIEGAFLEITTTLTCEIKTLAYPKAALFAFCLALLAYNAVSVIKAALRREHGRERINEGVSGYYLSLEISQTYDGMMVALPAPNWHVFGAMSVQDFAAFLRDAASRAKLSKYKKHTRGPKKPPPEKSKYKNGGHVSTAKLLAARKQC
jgi:hypothetical protein